MCLCGLFVWPKENPILESLKTTRQSSKSFRSNIYVREGEMDYHRTLHGDIWSCYGLNCLSCGFTEFVNYFIYSFAVLFSYLINHCFMLELTIMADHL